VTADALSKSRLQAAQAGLAAAREVLAPGPAPGERAMRTAYLELLKLCLCDLVGAGTTSVGRSQAGEVWARELTGEGVRLRAAGMDWPAHGLTMVGLRRLDDLQRCVEAVVADAVPGDLIEAGAWRGGASMLMRATLDSLGERDRAVWVADSFAGFPPAARAREDDVELAVFDFLAVPLEEVKASFARLGLNDGVTFLPGPFAHTLPDLADRRWSLVRLDADTYEATRHALDCLYPGLELGGYLIIDDYGALEECASAVEEFRREHGICEPLERIDWTGVRWRRTSDRPVAAKRRSAVPPAPTAAFAPRARERHVPTLREVELAAEAERLRARLRELESQLAAARLPLAIRLLDRARRALGESAR
jgi:O-methyltransferase